MRRRMMWGGVAACLALASCRARDLPAEDILTPIEPVPTMEAGASASVPLEATMGMSLFLEAFEEGGEIPDRYTCHGANDSPAVAWSGVPAEAQALVLMMYDPGAGRDRGAGNDLGFLHWMVYDLSPASRGMALGATGDPAQLAGGIETANDFAAAAGGIFPGGALIRGRGYDGPCPPAQHTYIFRLLALDQPLGFPAGTPYQAVMSGLEGHVLAETVWSGVFAP